VVATPKKSNKTTKKKAAASATAAKSEGKQRDAQVSMDRRASAKSDADRRGAPERRKQSEPVVVERRVLERRAKVSRRRQIDPTTCERDYTPDEIEFMNALDDYTRTSGRMFPTCSEILEVIKKLGYQKLTQPSLAIPLEIPPVVEQTALSSTV
jgi:hypothetical protein